MVGVPHRPLLPSLHTEVPLDGLPMCFGPQNLGCNVTNFERYVTKFDPKVNCGSQVDF